LIQDLTPEGLGWVMTHLRDKDWEEVTATVFNGDIDAVCQEIWTTPGLRFEARLTTGEPAVIGGVVFIWPGLANGWMFGTDRWSGVALEVTRTVKRVILPALDRERVHRLECKAIEGHTDVDRWLAMLGFQREAVIAQFGQGRQDFVLWARVVGHDASRTH
jgi:hypothetical protein